MSHRDHRGHGGFTPKIRRLVLFLALIPVAAVIVIALLPNSAAQTMRNAYSIQGINTGKALYTALFAQEFDNPLALSGAGAISWPTSDEVIQRKYADSSLFFATLVESNVIDVTYGFFLNPRSGIPPARDTTEFTDGKLHNMWCITLDVSSNTPARTPVLFTQNFKFKSRSPGATLDQFIGLDEKVRPFGYRGNYGIVITRGGAGFKLDATTAIMTNFNPRGATNSFLWPLASGQNVSGR